MKLRIIRAKKKKEKLIILKNRKKSLISVINYLREILFKRKTYVSSVILIFFIEKMVKKEIWSINFHI